MKPAIALAPCLLVGACVHTMTPSPPTVALSDFTRILGEDWTGALTYHDYSPPFGDVTIPATIGVTRVDGGLQLAIRYPKEPKENSTDVLKLPGKYGYKWPTLAEAYRHYTGQEISGAHDALVDTEACLVIFRALVETGVVELVGHCAFAATAKKCSVGSSRSAQSTRCAIIASRSPPSASSSAAWRGRSRE